MLGELLLGKYKVTRALDEGGMSKLYVARQQDRLREAAVKVLKEPLRKQAKACEHFRREIHILSRFHHPHAVGYYDSLVSEVYGPILIMEYLRGVDLVTLLHREVRLTPERAGRLLAQLCDVLKVAHEAGIVHRDVKPGNLMILHPGTPQETLKLMDFGLAKMSSLLYISPEELLHWNLAPASGTPEYIAPEMVRGNDQDGRGDLYSVGVVLYEMLTGRRPFLGNNVERLMHAHLNDPPPHFAEAGISTLPAGIEAVVRSCLAKHPEQRPANALDLAQRYEKALGKRISTNGICRASSDSHSGRKTMLAPNPGPMASIAEASEGRNSSPHIPRLKTDQAFRHQLEVSMPEAMALVKLKGFIYDLGGEVVESIPGLIKVRLADKSTNGSSSGGLFGFGRKPREAAPATEVELHMERRDANRPNQLTITLVMRPTHGTPGGDWNNRCSRISQDLGAYLMGSSVSTKTS